MLLARYNCRRCNKTECSKRCAIFVVYIADLEIFDLVVKGRALPYIANEGGIDKNIFAEVGIEYQRQCEKVL